MNSWDEGCMKEAINAVKNLGLGVKKASVQFNVHYSTLWDKLRQGTASSRLGRPPVFSEEVELEIATSTTSH